MFVFMSVVVIVWGSVGMFLCSSLGTLCGCGCGGDCDVCTVVCVGCEYAERV